MIAAKWCCQNHESKHQHLCNICAMWRIIRPATLLSRWKDGKPLFLCVSCRTNGAGTRDILNLVEVN